ncbi:hypothetical protein D3C78_1218170 [compost metagenome]
MKPVVSRFCAAEVWMPTFQMLVAWATRIISPPAKAERLSTPKAAITPSMIGTTQATRAVALGTMKLSSTVTTMAPNSTRWVLAPTRARVSSAMRLSSPVWVMAAAMNSAAATSASAELAKPARPMARPPLVPISCAGLPSCGALPSRKAISPTMMMALTS